MFLSHQKQQQHQPQAEPKDIKPKSTCTSSPSSLPIQRPSDPYDPSDPASIPPQLSNSLEKYGWFEDFDQFSPPHFQNQGQHQSQHDQHHHHHHHHNQQFYLFDDEDENEDVYNSAHRLHERELSMSSDTTGIHKTLQLPLPLTEPPSYILEAPLTSQHLW